MLKIGKCIGRVKSNLSEFAKVKRSKDKVTRSNEDYAQNMKYILQTSSDSENIPVFWKIEVAGANDRVGFLPGSS